MTTTRRTPRFRIRRMQEADLLPMAGLLQRLPPADRWTLRHMAAELHRPLGWAWVLDVWEEGRWRLAGYLILWEQGELLHIANIAVDPAHQGQGHGRRLMRVAKAVARRRGMKGLSLEVRVSNLRALRWYLRLGFQIRRRIRNLYQTPQGWEDGLYMVLEHV